MNVGSWLGLEQQDAVAKEVMALYNLYFDHSEVIQAEWQYFLREFEQRRGGNDDLRAVRDLATQRRMTSTKASNLPLKADQHLDFVLSSLETLREKVEQVLPLEERGREWQEEQIAELNADIEKETAAFDASITEKRKEVDRQFEIKKKELEEFYAVDEEKMAELNQRKDQQLALQKEQKWFGKRLV
mmetsp:Transcript_1869/g.6665  ORF Transcript_1869/g.6665 Transcript_1869/m.6665 type:complete len:187 (+) Transcript_1869:48-608(+)